MGRPCHFPAGLRLWSLIWPAHANNTHPLRLSHTQGLLCSSHLSFDLGLSSEFCSPITLLWVPKDGGKVHYDLLMVPYCLDNETPSLSTLAHRNEYNRKTLLKAECLSRIAHTTDCFLLASSLVSVPVKGTDSSDKLSLSLRRALSNQSHAQVLHK